MKEAEPIRLDRYINGKIPEATAVSGLAALIIKDDAITHNERFTVRTERMLLESAIYYTLEYAPDEDRTIEKTGSLIEEELMSMDYENYAYNKTKLNARMDDLEKRKPYDPAVKPYRIYEIAEKNRTRAAASVIMQIREFLCGQ